MIIRDYSDNPVANAWKDRYFRQTEEIRQRLDALSESPAEEYQLNVIKRTRKMPDVNWNELLLKPYIVGREYWTRGFFYNIPVKVDIPSELDYGFYRVGKGKYVDEYGRELHRVPALLELFGVATVTGVAYEIRKEMLIENL